MSWGYRTVCNYGMPRIRNYTQAKAHYDSVHPIRGTGRNAGRRPAGRRSDAGWNEMMLAEDGSIMFGWRGGESMTNIVTYHPDDTFTLFCKGWETDSTAKYISCLLGVNAVIHQGKIWIFDSHAHESHFKFPLYGKMKVKCKAYGGRIVACNPEPYTVRHIIRKEANNVRQVYKGATDLLRRIFKLRTNDLEALCSFSSDEFEQILDQAKDHNFKEAPMTFQQPLKYSKECCALLGSDVPEEVFKGVMWIISRSGFLDYRNMGRGGGLYAPVRNTYARAAELLDSVLLRGNHERCFKVVEKPNNSWTRDRWAHLFNV